MRAIMTIVAVLYLVQPLPAQRIPPGFTKISAGPNLEGWHISQVNHHGNTVWKVENGVLSVSLPTPASKQPVKIAIEPVSGRSALESGSAEQPAAQSA